MRENKYNKRISEIIAEADQDDVYFKELIDAFDASPNAIHDSMLFIRMKDDDGEYQAEGYINGNSQEISHALLSIMEDNQNIAEAVIDATRLYFLKNIVPQIQEAHKKVKPKDVN